MLLRTLLVLARHPFVAVIGIVIFGYVAWATGRSAVDQARQFNSDDPVEITDRALDRVFDRDRADLEIQSALAAGDVDLAQSFVALAADRGVAVAPVLIDEVNQAHENASKVMATAGRFVHGLWTGEPTDIASLAGTAIGDLFVFGDVRDAAREGTHYLLGQPTDPWVLGLAGAGIVVTAGAYASLGLGLPERVGLSLVKAARRVGRLNPVLAVRVAREAVKVEKSGGVVELVGDVGRIESKAGTRAALDSLEIAEEPGDVSRLARLSAAKGGKTRAIVKLLGRAAIILGVTAMDVAMWLLWASLAFLGFAASCKATAERVTVRYLERRRAAVLTNVAARQRLESCTPFAATP